MTNAKAATIVLPSTSAPLHERLADAIENLVSAGAYSPGDRLPTHRRIALETGVAIGTVTKAIDLLGRRGVVRGEVGRGTFVNRAADAANEIVDLTINGPPPLIPEADFLAATERAARNVAALPHGGYADLRGTAGQRATIAGWLERTRLSTSDDEIILCVGAQHAIHLAFADLKSVSCVVATESATFSGAIAAAADLGLTLAAIEHDEDGPIPSSLDRVLKEKKCRILYATPVCQNPLGFETSEARRREILKVCAKHDAFIVEDDIYALYSAKTPLTYKELAPDRVYYLTGLSKCLTPLMRVGVLIPPRDRRSAVAARLRAEVWGASPLATEIGCAMIELGIDRTMANILKSEARERVALAARMLGLKSLPMPEGAPHIWLPMPAIEAEKLARRTSEHGIRLTPPNATSVGGSKSSGIRLSVMAPRHRGSLEHALKTIAQLQAAPDETII